MAMMNYRDTYEALSVARSMQYDHAGRYITFRVGNATIVVPEDVMRSGGTHVVGREEMQRQKTVVCGEFDPSNVQDVSTPDVACSKKVDKNTSNPGPKGPPRDMCSKLLFDR